MAQDLRAMIVPGVDLARAQNLDVSAAGLQVAATPRHANVLLVIGPLSIEMRSAAAILYAQMMRPRAILALGSGELAPLPKADWCAELSQQHLLEGVVQLRNALMESAFQSHPDDFTASILDAHIEYTCSMHPEVVQDAPGSCPKCGMTLIPRESASANESGHDHKQPDETDMKRGEMDHGEMDHGEMDHGEMDHGEMDHGEMDHGEMKHGEMDHGGMDHGGMDHGGMDHGGMDHDEMGFMSMIEVTKDLPRSPDGLPMDWLDVPFGPVFPGLPGGLLLTLTLDGDAVAKVRTLSVVGAGVSLPVDGMKVDEFVENLAMIHPLTPMAYRVLVWRALEAASGQTIDVEVLYWRMAVLERERIASHLGWLAMLGWQIGFAWLERRGGRMQLECLRAELPQIMRMRPDVEALVARLAHTPFLHSRLSGIGVIAPNPGLRGPIARATGMCSDFRLTDDTYQSLKFEVMNRKGGDALARLHIRLDEMLQSFALIESAGILKEPEFIVANTGSGDSHAKVETPRGEASLHLSLENGRVMQAHLDTPSTFHLSLLPKLLAQQELGDALTTVCSLDLSPWEIVE
ncbi:MAG: NADH-quinone oxidoreductase subunit D-related protein [Sulfuriferula sp.]